MTQQAAEAAKEVARLTYAVPAQQKTLRSKQDTAKTAIVAVLALIAIVLIFIKPEIGWPAATIVGVFGSVTLVPKIIDSLKGEDRP